MHRPTAESRRTNRRCHDLRHSIATTWSALQPVLGARSRRLVPAISLITAVASGTPSANWPTTEQTPITQLALPEYWPNDPDYGPSARASSEPDNGQWWLYSFPPPRDPNALLLLQPELASGLSVDAAWRYGTGKPAVVLAFIDDGVDWNETDLADGYLLNPGELQLLPPRHSDGSPCARLVPTDPTSPRIDCSADGLATVADFREILGWHSDVVGEDPNHNGILDPDDIYIKYQNNVDDDGNGLIDDIAGWNFEDGTPNIGTTSAMHGTVVALDSIARIHNKIGGAGVCPSCLGLPIRVADQRGVDPQRLALAILYASSRGATAALVGHLPRGRSATLEKSIRVAAQRGMLVLFPLDGEQQNDALLSFDLDSWLPVGALTTDGDDDRTGRTRSFVSLDPLQALGPGVNLMGAGPSRSRRAPSMVLGTAGLMASASNSSRPRPTPLELAATLTSTADPIDPNLTTPSESPTRQNTMRRVNANAAVEAILNDLLPPEVEIDRPYWHEPILQDTAAAMVILGRVSATRADSIDLQVSVALGDRPDETRFRSLEPREGLNPSELSTPGSTLATVAARALEETMLTADRTSASLVTIRLRATAHYEASAASTTTEVDRRVVLLHDPDLVFGAPTRIGSKPTAPKLADLDDDGTLEIIVGNLDGELLIYAARDGSVTRWTSEPIRTRPVRDNSALQSTPTATPLPEAKNPYSTEQGYSPIVAPPAIADLGGDGQSEIIVASLDGDLFAFRADGSSPEGWSQLTLPQPPNDCPASDTIVCKTSSRLERGISSSPVVGDVDGDGQLDVVVAAHDGKVHAYDVHGQSLPGWPVVVGNGPNMISGRVVRSPALSDLDGDSVDDILVTAGEERSNDFNRGAHVLIVGARAPGLPRVAEGWPVGVTSYDIEVDRLDRTTPPAAIDLSGPYPRALLYGNASQPFFLPANPGVTQDNAPEHSGQLPGAAEPVSTLDGRPGFRTFTRGALSEYAAESGYLPMLARPSIGDLDRDSFADVVLPGFTMQSLYALRDNSHMDRQPLLGMFSGATGQMLHASPIALDGFLGQTSAAIADLTNDGYPEVVLPTGRGGILAVDACGRSAPGWPKLAGGAISGTPAIGDLDGNGFLEVVVTTDDGWLYIWTTGAKADNYIAWASAGNDTRNTSSYTPPTADTAPLPLDFVERCAAAVPSPASESRVLSARAGCACSVPSTSKNSSSRYAALATCLLLSCRRTTRRKTNAR